MNSHTLKFKVRNSTSLRVRYHSKFHARSTATAIFGETARTYSKSYYFKEQIYVLNVRHSFLLIVVSIPSVNHYQVRMPLEYRGVTSSPSPKTLRISAKNSTWCCWEVIINELLSYHVYINKRYLCFWYWTCAVQKLALSSVGEFLLYNMRGKT